MKHLRLLVALLALLTGVGNLCAQTDVTSTYITNAGFDNCTAETSDVATKTIKDYSSVGWTNVNTGGFTTIAVTAYGGAKVGGSSTPSTKKDGTTVSGNTLGIIAGWADNVTIQSGEITLPAGVYTLTVDHYLTSSTNNYGSNSSKFGFVTSDDSYLVSSTVFTASTWTTETVTFTLTESTTGKIQIGLTGLNKSGSGAPAVFYDDVTITWTDPNAAANAAKLETAKYTLNGYIKKATALNSVLGTLTDAIATAQAAYDAANDYTKDYDNTVAAAGTLNTTITTALSGTTAVSLTNGNFDTGINISLDGTNSANYIEPATAAKPYIYPVTGWEQNFKFSQTASQGNTAVYGATITGDKGNNGTNPPATDMYGNTEGGTLHLSSGWSDQARYKQVIESLPSGRYIFYYEANNQNNSANSINSNYFGVSGASGDFYGSTNSFIYSDVKSFTYNEWTANAFEFDVAKEADITFHVGVVGTTEGSGKGAKLWIDNVLVYRIGDITMSDADASAILAEVDALNEAVYNATDKNNLATAKSAFESSKTIDNYNALNEALIAAKASVTIYETLNTAITNVESWTSDKTNVTDPIRTKYTKGEYSNETTADNIYEAYQAAEIAALAAAEATDYTSAILNHSFETGDMTGWSAESRNDTGVKENSNGTYTTTGVDGTYLFNSWGGTAENNVYQTIKGLPAGTYQLSALLAGFPSEELILAANETTNSVTVSGDKTMGYAVNVVFTLDEAGDVVIKASNTKAAEGSDASFIKADNFTLKAYSDPLAALKEQLATLKGEASAALESEDYENVTGSEKTTLESLVNATPEETEEAYNSAINSLTGAIDAFKNAKTAYDAYAVSAAIEQAELPYAREEKYAAIATEKQAPANATEAGEKAISIVNAIRAYVESNGLAEGVEGAVNKTSLLTNSTNPTNTNGWTITNTNGDSKMRIMSSEPYTNSNGSTATGYFDSNSWGNAFSTKFTQEVELEAGKYILTAKARGNGTTTYQIVAGENSTDMANSGNTGGVFGRGWNDYTVEFEVEEKASVTLGINMVTGSNSNWLSFGDFRLVRLELYTEMATAEDYEALNAAITAAEEKTLGFDAGEFAPYKNIETIKTLAAAKAIDQNAENVKADITAMIESLSNGWTANTEEVDAIFDGQFATTAANTTSGDINLPGWTKVNGIRLLVKDEATDPGLAYTDGKAAVFSWGGTTLIYGEQDGYTLPMNKNEIYELTFKVSGWHDGDLPNWISVTLDEESKTYTETVPGRINDAEGNPFATLTFYVTPTADNSILKIFANKHFTIADLSMKLANAIRLTDEAEVVPETTTNEVTVLYDRKLLSGWNSLVLPFEVTQEELGIDNTQEGERVLAYTGTTKNGDNYTLNFEELTGNLAANTPYLIKKAADGENMQFSGKIISPDEPKVADAAYTFAGTYVAISKDDNKIKAGDLTVGKSQLNKAKAFKAMKAFRAYFRSELPTEEAQNAKITVNIDGQETDAITAIEIINAMTEGVYNLQGQKVNKAQRGVYIVNGKKVVVK